MGVKCMPKPSKFIITVKDGEKISLFNTLTSSVVRLDTELYEKLFICNDFENETEIVSTLKQMGFLVEDTPRRQQAFRQGYCNPETANGIHSSPTR